MAEKSLTFRLLRKVGLNFSEEEYGQISLFAAASIAIKGIIKAILLKYCMYSVILSPLNYRKIRPMLWRWIGAKVGKNAFIGYEVWMDFNNAHLIEIGEGTHITNRCLLLCHQRDLSNYYIGDNSTKLPYKKGKIIIGKNVMIGMGTIIMPGVSIGEGSIIGAGSIVSKDIPAWKIATGRPARVIKEIPQKPIA
ncbi:acyltransferase [Mariniphaga sp.]|uniref:acyltransferase n=1 Tax=Mariniphaga sp. TaxID=1954475 RepID=UPI003562C796